MTYWLVANPKAGDGQRGREFWLEQLAACSQHKESLID